MAIRIGQQLGSYEITALLGKGGMGEVYRARDTRLDRDVAIKTLPEEFEEDAERLARFAREAKFLASLNHSNIAAIYGLEQYEGKHVLILELVEGETLADHLRRGPIAVDESLRLAAQIADALQAAHEKGVIHRDLKPANIKLTADGTVKVLDFGLAKASGVDSSEADVLSNSPTLRTLASSPGMILGTAAYMSPEQAKGRPVDRRTDIFAFGCVVYEMLTGAPAFQGEAVGEILARVIEREPEWSKLPAKTPPRIRELLRLCLQKDAKKRRQTAADVRIDIEQALNPAAEIALAPAASRTRERLWMGAAALFLAGMASLAIVHFREAPAAGPPEMRTEIVTPDTTDPISFALSPDGRQIVFVASGDGASRLWVRSLTSTNAQPLAGTEGAAYPFWSPDSRSIGFFSDAKLKRLDLAGGSPQVLASVAVPRGGTWNADGVILFTPSALSPLFRMTALGGEAVAVTKLEGQRSHRFPFFLPDGRQFLFFVSGTPGTEGIYLGALDSAETHRLTAAESPGVYVSSGWLLWVRAGTLVAQHLDLQRKALTGDPVTLADAVAIDAPSGAGAVSVSVAGLVAYRPGRASRRQLAWFDRSGRALGAMGVADERELVAPSVSPDGHRVAVSRAVEGNLDIWLLDETRTRRFTFDVGVDRFPIWSADGSQIVFDSNRKVNRDLYEKPLTGGAEELLVESPQSKVATHWSADGRFLLYQSNDPQTDWDLWVLPLDDRKPWVFLKTRFQERNGQFSPDGRWVAYMSNESGQQQVYIRPFAVPAASGASSRPAAGQWQVSTTGGIFPRWRADGKELYYISPIGEVMAVPITATTTAPEPGAPVSLFRTRIVGGGAIKYESRQYDVTRDGRFLINTVLDDGNSAITLLMNWKPQAK